MPSKHRKDFILKENYKKVKRLKKEYLNEDLMVEVFLKNKTLSMKKN
jgi:hypothetical protein